MAHPRVIKSWAEEMDEIDRQNGTESDSEDSTNEELKLVQEGNVNIVDTDLGKFDSR